MSAKILLIAAGSLVTVATLQAAPSNTVPGADESIHGRLLDDLGDALLKPRPADASRQPLPVWPHPPTAPEAGEDVNPATHVSPLVPIEAGMRAAEKLLADHDTGEDTRGVQRQVVAALDELIDQLDQQCQSCSGNGQCEKPKSQRSETQASKPGNAAGQGRAAAQNSTTRVDTGQAKAVDTADMQELLKELWGHLPVRVREQLMQSASDEFLPKYQLDIEQYFRGLAEENDRQ